MELKNEKNRGVIKREESKNEIIKEANEEIEEILSDSQMKAWNEYLQTAIWEESSRQGRARREGIKSEKNKNCSEFI